MPMHRCGGFSTNVIAASVPPCRAVGRQVLGFYLRRRGTRPTGTIVKGGIEAEARQCFANINHALERSGAAFKDIVRITAYLKDLADYPGMPKSAAEFFGADWPASATVAVSDLLLGAKLEVDAVAAVRRTHNPSC